MWFSCFICIKVLRGKEKDNAENLQRDSLAWLFIRIKWKFKNLLIYA